MKDNYVLTEFKQRAHGVIQCQVLEKGKVVRSFRPQKNLILNLGLDTVCGGNLGWGQMFTNCVAGTGTTATNVVSGGGNTGSGASSTFTGPGTFNFTTGSAVGDMIKMTSGASTGTELRILTVTDATHVEYTPTGAVSAGEFTVYHTSQTSLATEVKRTSTYLTGTGNCGSSLAGSDCILKRTYDFSTEGGTVTYNEVAFSWTATPGANLFSRVKLASGVVCLLGQQLRVIYVLTITLSPTTLTPITYNITGWPVAPSTSLDGDQQWQRAGIGGIGVSGDFSILDAGGTEAGWCMEPSRLSDPASVSDPQIWISSVATPPTTFGSAPVERTTNRETKTVQLIAYTALDFYRDRFVTFAVGEANRTDWRSMGIGNHSFQNGYNATSNGTGFVCIFDEAQTKSSLYTLTLTFRISVGRTLA